MMGYYGYGSGWGYMGGFGLIFMVIFWAVIVICVVAVVRRVSCGGGRHFHGGNSALEILKEGHAKGEIDRKEFEEKKKDLM